MSKPENTFIASVHRHFVPGTLYSMKNNNQFNGGIADDWYSGKGPGSKDLWIEWKFIKVPVRDATLVDIRAGKKPALSALQQEWLKERYAEGRNVWVGIGSKDGGVLLTECRWEEPFTAGWFRKAMVPRKDLARYIMDFVKGAT